MCKPSARLPIPTRRHPFAAHLQTIDARMHTNGAMVRAAPESRPAVLPAFLGNGAGLTIAAPGTRLGHHMQPFRGMHESRAEHEKETGWNRECGYVTY